MKSPYVSELQANQVITATFLVQHKDIRQKKTGEPYLSLVLGDRTGDIDAKMWDNVAEVMDSFERDDFLKVRGLLQIHQNRLQLTLHKLQKQESDSVDAADYFPASLRNPDEMFAELLQYVGRMQNPHLKTLLEAMLNDSEIGRRFKIAPAAKNIHHAYLSGLLEHVVSLCGLARMAAEHYKNIDLDLLLAGVILHDIGKIHELTYDRSFGYSTEGQLLGHIVIALRMLDEKLRAMPDFPPKLRSLLDHMIVSHHGELEYGSPKLPVFPEALLLHHLDNLDAKMETMRAFLEKDRQVDGCWTGYSPTLERSVLKKSRYLEDAPAETQALPSDPPAMAAAAAPRPSAPPQRPPRPAPSSSHFGQLLQGALKRDSDA